MLPSYVNIESGVLLYVKKGFWTSGDSKDGLLSCKRFIPKGEVIEIRYPYAWHFRTTCNTYDHQSEQVLRKNCDFFGVIDKDVRFANSLKLREILDQKLYHDKNQFKLILKHSPTKP